MGLARTLTAEQVTASRPADPGVGEGIDLVLVIADVSPDPVPDPKYSERVAQYVVTVLQPEHLYVVNGLVEIVENLKQRGRESVKVRRLRIVGHGSHDRPGAPFGSTGGKTLMRDPTGRRGWIPPAVIEEYAKGREVREVMNQVLTPGAVVEFWGCSLGSYETAGKAWANLFGRTFVAPTHAFEYAHWEIWVRRRRYRQGQPVDRPKEVVLDQPPGGPWVYRRVFRSSQAAAWGPMATEDLDSSLRKVYERLHSAGELPDFSGQEGGVLGAMRRLFDAQGGVITILGPERLPAKKGEPVKKGELPYLPDEPGWGESWKAFPAERTVPPAKSPPPPATEAKPVPPPAPPPTPAHPAPAPSPPPPQPAPAQPPPAPVVPPPAPPVKVVPSPAPPAAPGPAAITPPAPSRPAAPAASSSAPARTLPTRPARPPPAPGPSEAMPSPAPRPAVRAAAAPLAAETDWARQHPEGRVSKLGSDEWLLWNFAVGSDAVRPEHAGALREVCASLSAAPGKLVIDGYASASGSVSRNVRLSTGRARSTADLLTAFGAQPTLVTIRGHGERPHSPDPEAAARERAVRISIPARDRRRPLPAPQSPGQLEWKVTPPPQQPPPGPAPERSPVGVSFEYKFSVKKRVPLGPDWYLIGEIEVGAKGEFAPQASLVLAPSYKHSLDSDRREKLLQGKFNDQLKIALSNAVTLSGSVKEGTISVTFKGRNLKAEVGVGLGDLLADPAKLQAALKKDPEKLFTVASVKFTPFELKTEEYDLGDLVPALRGFHVRGTLTPKVIVSLSPSPLLVSRLGMTLAARAGPVGAGIVLGAAWTVLALYLIDRAHKRGESWAQVVDLRRGYAYRVAAEALDWQPGQPPGAGSTVAWDKARSVILDTLPHGRPGQYTEKEERPMRLAYASLYEGWEAAGEALRALDRDQYDQLMPRLRELGGATLPKLSETIMLRLGGSTEKETPLDLRWLQGPDRGVATGR
jgi:outer membrane protein OmpA-like peptidoglycan-associated protein